MSKSYHFELRGSECLSIDPVSKYNSCIGTTNGLTVESEFTLTLLFIHVLHVPVHVTYIRLYKKHGGRLMQSKGSEGGKREEKDAPLGELFPPRGTLSSVDSSVNYGQLGSAKR